MAEQLTEELNDYLRQFRENKADAEGLCSDLSEEQFNWRSAPGRWSVAQCLVHLTDGARVFTHQIRAATKRAHERGQEGSGPFTYGRLSRWFLKTMEPPVHKRYKSLRRYVPTPEKRYDKHHVLEEFQTATGEWEKCLYEANGLHLAKVKVRHPVNPLMRFQLGALFAGMAAHERRHLWQAKEVMKIDGYPTT